jgi:hypothetical protein
MMEKFSVGVFTVISIFLIIYVPIKLWFFISEVNRELIVVFLQIFLFLGLMILALYGIGDLVIDIIS